MPDRNPPPAIYQLRVVVHGVSPLIWRRLLVPAEATIAQLHDVLQTAFGWSGEHLHSFTVHGAQHGICCDGGPVFRDDARRVRLATLGLREGERFTGLADTCRERSRLGSRRGGVDGQAPLPSVRAVPVRALRPHRASGRSPVTRPGQCLVGELRLRA